MTIRRTPPGARLDQHGNRLYTWAGTGQVEEFYSVTTAIHGGIPKYLVPWAAKLVAELAYHDVLTLGTDALEQWAREGRALVDAQRAAGAKLASIDESPEGLALRYLKGEPDRVRDAAGDRGSAIHEAAEDLVLAHAREASRLVLEGRPLPTWPEEIRPHMEYGFVPWLRAYRPRFLSAEATVYNRTHAYAGTSDAFCEIWGHGRWWAVCVDYKSGKRAYPEVGVQTEAYRRGEFVGGADGVTEFPVPDTDATALLHLTPKGFDFRWLGPDPREVEARERYADAMFRTFLYSREIFRFAIELSKSVIGERIPQDLEESLAASLEQVRAAS